jgi:hypothetical protein
MSVGRVINKSRNFVLRKLDKWEIKNKFKIDFDSLKYIIDRDFDILIKKGLKFNINLPVIKIFLINELERICLKIEKNENITDFNILFALNSNNDTNKEFLDLEKHKNVLNSEIYRPILESMYVNGNKGQPPIDPVLNFSILYFTSEVWLV